MATGDRPNFPLANQRLDKVDIEAISDLVGENIMRTVGGLLGPCAGLLSDVTVTYDSGLQTITIGACRLGYAKAAPGSSVAIDGGVVRWDPAIDPTGGTISVALFGTNQNDDGYVFFKREEFASDEENRAYYDALAQEKKVGVANTRIRETISLGTALTYDGLSRDDGWFPFLYLKWFVTGGEPSVYKISAFDGFGGGVDNAGVARAFGGDQGLGVDWDEGYVGVSRLFREVIGSLQHAYDNDFTLNNLGSVTSTISEQAYRWTGYGLVRGLKQLHADLSTAETTLNPVPGQITDINAAIAPIAVWQGVYVDKQPLLHAIIPVGFGDSGAGYVLTPTNQVHYVEPGVVPIPIPSWVRQTEGRLELTWTSPPFTQNGTVVQLTAFSPSGTTYASVVCSYRWAGASQLYIYTRNVETATWVNASIAVSIFNVGQTTT